MLANGSSTPQQGYPIAHLPLALGVLRCLEVATVIDRLIPAGIALNEFATHGPIKHFPHEGQDAVGLNRGATFDEMIQERNDITATNIVRFPCPH